ncbi:MAG: antibiotic biosynthesis monooxygenase family protein [Burkholderiales bacterium]
MNTRSTQSEAETTQSKTINAPAKSTHRLSTWRTLLVTASALIGGCAISTPYPRINKSPDEIANSNVVVVVTHITVNGAERAEFDRQTRRVVASLSGQPGLVGYSVRREILGNQAWTLTVWDAEEARQNFVSSGVHREAIGQSAAAIAAVQFKRITMPRKQVPADWSAALKLLAEPDNLRQY